MSIAADMETSRAEEFGALNEQALKAQQAYYAGTPIIMDDEYDAIIDRMEQLAEQYPVLRENSVLDMVGTADTEGSVKHPIPMLSLAKITDMEKVGTFLKGIGIPKVMVQPKLDGVSLSLEYSNGSLTRAVTRGDGVVGEDVTHIVRHLPSVPETLQGTFTGVVRGEVVIHRDELNPRYKNTRNAVSGLLNYRTSTPKKAAEENCRFYAFDLYGEGVPNAMLASLSLYQFGFTQPVEQVMDTTKAVTDYIEILLANRPDLPYDIDGVVVKVSDFATRERLGYRSNSPRWAFAFKPESATAVTKLNGVTWQTGKGGTVTPVAELEPVDLMGVTISRASLHNLAQIEKLGITIGDDVIVKRANDVIPQVSGVAVSDIMGEAIKAPYSCPTCSYTLEQKGNSKQVVCPNYNCSAQVVGRLVKWASKEAADIDAIGPSWIEAFVEAGLVEAPADFYSLTRADLAKLPRMGEGNVKRFVESIQQSKECGMARALIGLAIPMLGEGTAERLTRVFESVEAVQRASASGLASVPDVGDVAATTIHRWMNDPHVIKQIHRLRERGVNLDRPQKDTVVATDGPLVGKRVAITGTLWTGRDTIVKCIEAAGGTFDKSVSSKTDILFIADPNSTTTKARAARDKGVLLVGPDDAQRMLGIA
jgi:DNA ligase (NAD+)